MAKVRQYSVRGVPANRPAARGLALGALALALGACNIFSPGAPRVTGVDPADGATGVPLGSSVRATLALPDNGQLDVSTLTDAAVTLTDSSGAAVPASRFPEGDALVVDPEAELETDETYTFTVTPDVKTATGTPLARFSSSFSTGTGAVVPEGLVAEQTPLVFSAGGSSRTDTRALTLRNAGTTPVNVTGVALTGAAAARFALADAAPFTLEAGATRDLSLTFTPSGVGPQLAALSVSSSGNPDLVVPLGGLGVTGQGGNKEPSLQYILDTYGLRIDTGDEDPSTYNLTDDKVNDVLGSEVPAQYFTKADPAEAVSLTVLGSFGVANDPVFSLGYYTAGSRGAQTELLSVLPTPPLNEQSLDPDLTPAAGVTVAADGSTVSFDPGAGNFGLYSFWPTNQFFGERTVYTEDDLNTFTGAVPHQVRAYPLVNADGTAEPNAYVVATEEFSSGFDYNDAVLILRNVVPGGEINPPAVPIPPAPTTPPANGIAGLTVRNALGFPYPDRLVLQTIESTTGGNVCEPTDLECNPNKWEGIVFPESGVVTLQNTGVAPLQLSLSIQNDNLFVISGPTSLTLQPGATQNVTVTFAPQGFDAKGVYPAGLLVQSGAQSAGLQLRGLYMLRPEGSREVYFAPLVNDLFGYATDLGEIANGGLLSPAPDSPLAGEEVRSALWEAADPSSPVSVLQLAAFYPCCNISEFTLQLVAQNGSALGTLRHRGTDTQSILPRQDDGEIATLTVNPNGPFSIKSAGYSTLDVGQRNLGVRLWPVRDRSGTLVADTYIVAQDFVRDGCNGFGGPDGAPDDGGATGDAQAIEPTQAGIGSNCDYQDNLYLIENVQPAN